MCGRYYLDEQLKYDLTKWVIIPDGHIFPYGDTIRHGVIH